MARSHREDEEDRLIRRKMLGYCVIAASLVILIFLYMLYKNNEERHQRLAAEAREQQKQLEELKAQQEELEELGVGQKNLRSEDLDFWDMYEPEKKTEPEKEEEFVPEKPPVTPLPKKEDKETENELEDPGEAVRPQDDAPAETEEEPGDDDKHIGITDPNGKTIYYEIMDEVPRNEYTMASSLSMENGRLSYNDGSIRSLNGVVVNKNQGIIDWAKVKADGIDFAMVKVAFRGYDSGLISLDNNFVINSKGAVANGIAVGTYFSSQAISEAEAVEEANFTVGAISQYGITYPVAIYIENIKNDSARTDSLTMEERTSYVKTYLDTVKSYGFTPAIYADRNTLIKDLDLSKLRGYSVFLADPVDFGLAKEQGMSTEPAPKLLPTPIPSGASSTAQPSYTTSTTATTSVNGQVSSASYDVSAMAQKKQTSSSEKVSSSEGIDEKKNGSTTESGVLEPKVKEKKWYTDFPYRFSIWQYDQTGEVDGINGSVPLAIGFVDYSQR